MSQAMHEKRNHLLWAMQNLTSPERASIQVFPGGFTDSGVEAVLLRTVIGAKEIEFSLPGVLRVRDVESRQLLAMSCAPDWLQPVDAPSLVAMSLHLIEDTANRMEAMSPQLGKASGKVAQQAARGAKWLRVAGPSVMAALLARSGGLLDLDEEMLRQIAKGKGSL